MSVIVKGMKMPENCGMCDLAHRNFDGNETRLACYALRKWAEESGDVRLPDCPLVELPEKHNRLLDERKVMWAFNDAILDEAKKTGKCRATWNEVYSVVKTVPTVLEAEDTE